MKIFFPRPPSPARPAALTPRGRPFSVRPSIPWARRPIRPASPRTPFSWP